MFLMASLISIHLSIYIHVSTYLSAILTETLFGFLCCFQHFYLQMVAIFGQNISLGTFHIHICIVNSFSFFLLQVILI